MSTTKTLPRTGTLLRIGKLDTLTGVRQEMTRIYRASRRGEIDTQDLTRFVFTLRCIAQVIEQSDLEARMVEIEKRLLQTDGHEPRSETTTH